MARDPYRYFRIEAAEIADQLSRGASQLAHGTAPADLVPHLLRLAHTLKGAAHVVKQAQIASLAHEFEDVLAPVSKASGIAPEQGAALLRLVDGIARELTGIGGAAPEQAAQAPGRSTPDESLDTIRVEFARMDELLRGLDQSAVQVNAITKRIARLHGAARTAAALAGDLSPAGSDNGRYAPAALARARSLAEELQASLKSLHGTLAFSAGRLARELEEVRGAAASLRLVPADTIFPTLERAVRNSAQTLGKKVVFETAGGENSLDAHVLSALRDTLLHLVRNAVAHGIEAPAARLAAGKPEAGRVAIRVMRRGSRVTFACEDDGGGFDLTALRRAAAVRGLLPEQTEAAESETILALILRGGITTSPEISEMSGRGIGLDVLRQTAAHLKADVSLATEAGAGSKIVVTVPVSLLSLEAVVVESAGEAASVPIDAVLETVRLGEGDVVRHAERDAIVYEGRAIPYAPLGAALRQRAAVRPRHRSAASSAVILRSGGNIAAVGVDRVLGTARIVLRPIAPFAGADPVVAGASIDSDGNPRIVLDPAALVECAGGAISRPPAAAAPSVPAVLVIDDSITTRMLEKSILESAGYEVETAISGEEALEKARARRYNLFVVDIEMPGMDGFEFIQRTRSEAALSGTPAILVTSRSSDEDRRRGIQMGARGYIVKGEFDQGALLNTIKGLVG